MACSSGSVESSLVKRLVEDNTTTRLAPCASSKIKIIRQHPNRRDTNPVRNNSLAALGITSDLAAVVWPPSRMASSFIQRAGVRSIQPMATAATPPHHRAAQPPAARTPSPASLPQSTAAIDMPPPNWSRQEHLLRILFWDKRHQARHTTAKARPTRHLAE